MYSGYDGYVRDAAIALGVDSFVIKGSQDWDHLHREVVRLVGSGSVH
jgi:hypothetical protein